MHANDEEIFLTPTRGRRAGKGKVGFIVYPVLIFEAIN